MTPEQFDDLVAGQDRARAERLAATTPHIRQRLRPRGGNQFYRDRSERTAATMCGAEVTEVDFGFSPTRKTWPATVCAACVEARVAS